MKSRMLVNPRSMYASMYPRPFSDENTPRWTCRAAAAAMTAVAADSGITSDSGTGTSVTIAMASAIIAADTDVFPSTTSIYFLGTFFFAAPLVKKMRKLLLVAVVLILLTLLRMSAVRMLCPRTAKIFVSVPSYRDVKCSETIDSMFSNARYPDRVVVAICQQNAEAGEMCLKGVVSSGEARLVSIHSSQARGPCKARYLCATLMREEDIYLSIDSHTMFSKDWDVAAVHMLNEAFTKRGGTDVVLSTHPIDTAMDNWREYDVPVIDTAAYDGVLQFSSNFYEGKKFRRARQVGAGFMLCHSNVIKRVPLDPGLDGLFNGEEYLYTARLFTNGIDVWSPNRNIVAHIYSYENHQVPWANQDDNNRWANGHGVQRCNDLLTGRVNDRFGMGSRRSLQKFWRYINVDYDRKIVAPFSCSEV